jgi:putative transposase
MKYQFIAEYQHEYPITAMCRVLEVAVSGYYAWRKRTPSQHSREDAQLAEKVKMAFQANRRVYGSPRVHAELHAQGIYCGKPPSGSFDARARVICPTPTPSNHYHGIREKGAQVAPNLLQRDFHAEAPDQKWVADTTSIWTREGWLFHGRCA